jgi:uncharacterized protein involved in response to NO
LAIVDDSTGQRLALVTYSLAAVRTQGIYLCALAGALMRICAAVVASTALLEVAALVWVAAFVGFAVFYGPLLVRRRVVS